MAIKGGWGVDATHWKGGRTVDPSGYVRVFDPDHARANPAGYVWEHIAIAERALGKPLPPRAEIHHADENKANNAGGNLVVCPDRAYHMLLHKRAAALAACGDANALRCRYCSGYDRQSEMRLGRSRGHHVRAEHRTCAAAYQRKRKARIRAQRAA